MAGKGKPFEVRRIAAGEPDHLRALHLALDAESSPTGEVAPPVADLLSNAAQGSISLELVFGTYQDGALLSAAAVVESPGATGLVFVPQGQMAAARLQATIALLGPLQRAAWDRPIQLLEVLLIPEAVRTAQALRETGFHHLTQLVYLGRRLEQPVPAQSTAHDLVWVSYAPDLAPLFCDALDATYVESLDCPELTGLRRTIDVLAGHRATGVFDPSLWWVAKRGKLPVGVLLLNGIASYPSLEIVYLGVAQVARGTGVADALVARAVTLGQQAGVTKLTLAVDRRNTPARRMYARWGFVQALTRDAWIASPSPT